jgi:F-type H+-transporting ATPase subunit b
MMFKQSFLGLMLVLATTLVAAMTPQSASASERGGSAASASAAHGSLSSDAPRGHEGGAPNTSPLEWQSDLALWTGVVFVVLMLLLWKLAWGPIADGLAKRERGIANQIDEAHKANQDAQTRLDEYQRKLDAAGEDVRRMLADARRGAEESGRQIVEASRNEAKVQQQKALAEIDQATADAVAELAARSAQLAVELAGKIVKAELRPADHAALVQQAVQSFTKPSEN